ncbi:unnamed protein product [Protopolystoma xenopodis]|uniref:Uncharacterized protein n=1 Tax=Protopolystoma xenopodis TaxID=117903 RepID=A0A3S5BEG5_9PLAT|nr:unnamed protein product [Protopolystoma xenopodis]
MGPKRIDMKISVNAVSASIDVPTFNNVVKKANKLPVHVSRKQINKSKSPTSSVKVAAENIISSDPFGDSEEVFEHNLLQSKDKRELKRSRRPNSSNYIQKRFLYDVPEPPKRIRKRVAFVSKLHGSSDKCRIRSPIGQPVDLVASNLFNKRRQSQITDDTAIVTNKSKSKARVSHCFGGFYGKLPHRIDASLDEDLNGDVKNWAPDRYEEFQQPSPHSDLPKEEDSIFHLDTRVVNLIPGSRGSNMRHRLQATRFGHKPISMQISNEYEGIFIPIWNFYLIIIQYLVLYYFQFGLIVL